MKAEREVIRPSSENESNVGLEFKCNFTRF